GRLAGWSPRGGRCRGGARAAPGPCSLVGRPSPGRAPDRRGWAGGAWDDRV
ncbi:MAG: hypothetical protein AVDCRST_MAG49-2465, partial [uncultured Thermomicrobiales bacterium]